MTPTYRATFRSGVVLAFRAISNPDAYAHAARMGAEHNVGEPLFVQRLYGPAAAGAELDVFQYGPT